ncbi:Alpha-mannosidase [Caenorhabditis elegans]|uniref:Alpha-mannosidase n=1 Tax=Caenorhabditis elegans TaxID=6239 RepID=Q20829_CAEEL|nr:Alpha-mannosidase [Caenorhabditis elegans]CCD67087.1 Alpha-mannosidase [Caenorhabditis elegans]|eukprot:NP_508811.1 Alpha-mannosidase [Caenorhabditis elegans]
MNLQVIFLFLGLLVIYSSQDCAWNTCHKVDQDPNVITAHLIPHTHDDLGWIKTVDQYFWGAKPELVPVGVQYIYNTVIDELLKNPDRRFSFAETGFLWRWYTSNSDFDRHQLQKLVKNGQIEIIGGGWVQNDEATSHYVDIIDQMTLGLQRLEQIFGECGKPVTGWQIDPFGHSREMANIYREMGYSSVYFARIHYLEKQIRLKNKTLEFMWNTSDDITDNKLFTGAFFNDNYGPPEGFCWDSLCGDDPIMDNLNIEGYNVKEKVDAFVDHVKNQAAHQSTNQVMLLMGSDFQYTNANSWYVNLDKLIKYVNADTSKKVRVIYSTPACYTKAVQAKTPTLSVKHDDFFPYASGRHSYWTGYFTSRPAFKGMIRQASCMLQLAKQLDVIANLGPEDDSDIEILREASALVQHHDAVTGTAKENVTRDYEKQLAKGVSEVEVVINDFMKKMNPDGLDPKLVLCPLINETICKPINGSSEFSVVIFNSNGRYFNGTIRIPYSQKTAVLRDAHKNVLESQIVETFQIDQLKDTDRLPYEIHVFVRVPPLGYTTVFVEKGSKPERVHFNNRKKFNTNVEIQNEYLIAGFDSQGYLSYITEKATKKKRSIRQEFFYYEGIDSKDDQPSGAYIFRPKTQQPIALTSKLALEVVPGAIINEVRQKVSPFVSQQIRLPRGKNYIEFEWIVGPIPKETKNPITKEFVTRYTTEVHSKNQSFTDSNGRQAMERFFDGATSFEYSDTEPIAGNYYPITSFGYIKDENAQFSVITDRAQGMVASDGVVEIMLHRRCFYDDHFGVEEALDEPGKDGAGLVAMGKHIVLFTDVKASTSQLRPLAIDNFHQPVLAFNKNPEKFEFNRLLEYSGLKFELPIGIHLLTLEKWHKKSSLIRFENIYHGEEGNSIKEFDPTHIFTNFDIVSFKELLLGANRVVGKNKESGSSFRSFEKSKILTFEIEVERKMSKL